MINACVTGMNFLLKSRLLLNVFPTNSIEVNYPLKAAETWNGLFLE